MQCCDSIHGALCMHIAFHSSLVCPLLPLSLSSLLLPSFLPSSSSSSPFFFFSLFFFLPRCRVYLPSLVLQRTQLVFPFTRPTSFTRCAWHFFFLLLLSFFLSFFCVCVCNCILHQSIKQSSKQRAQDHNKQLLLLNSGRVGGGGSLPTRNRLERSTVRQRKKVREAKGRRARA